MRFTISHKAQTQLKKIEKVEARRILSKLAWYEAQKDPLHFARLLRGHDDLYRFRVGKYRIVITPKGEVLVVLRIAPRDAVYKGL